MIVQADSEQFRMLSLMVEDTTRGMCIYQAATAKEQRLVADELKNNNRKQTLIIDMADYAKNIEDIPTDIQKFRRILDKSPQAQVIIVCNLQLCGLWMGDSAYIEKLNYMRDQLMECDKMWVFGMTPYFSILMSQEARDLYTYIMYNCSFVTEEDRDIVSYDKSKEYTGDIRLLVSQFEEYKGYISVQMETGDPDSDLVVRLLEVWVSCAEYLNDTAAEWVRNLADRYHGSLVSGKTDGEKLSMYKLLTKVYIPMEAYQKAIEFLNDRLELAKRLFQPGTEEIANIYADRAYVYLKKGNFPEAKEYSDKSLKIYKKLGKEYSLQTVDIWDYNAQLLMKEQKYEEAIVIYKKNIQIIRDGSNESNYRMIVAYNNLARTYMEMGELTEALKWFKKSQEIAIKYHSGNTEAETAILNNISGIYQRMGDLGQAKKALLKAKKNCEHSLGGKHETEACVYHNLATVYCDLGQWNPSEKYYKKAIEIRKEIHGEENTNLAHTYMCLASMYLQEHAVDHITEHIEQHMMEAYVYMVKAVRIWEEIYPNGHSDVADAYEVLARLHYIKEDFSEALVWMNRAQKLNIKLHGKDSQIVQSNEYNIELIKKAKEREK